MKRTQRYSRGGRPLAGAIAALTLVGSGLAAVAGPAQAAEEPALDWSNYERTTITKDVGEPIGMTILPDNRIIHTARNGEVRLTDPATGITKIVNKLDVYVNSEDGLQGIAIDPDFEENGWVYLVYSPRDADGDGVADTPTGSAPHTLPAGEDESYWDRWLGVNRLARFKWTGEALDLSTEQAILDVEVQRGQCCHVGADIDFDGEGNLYLSTGDNTPAGTPGASGYAPNNDAPGMNPGFDARRGAGNTNDLRGKILRIHVEEDGSYTIPEGNLFEPGTPNTRPEIFIMGVRNPFRIDVDAETNTISYGDYGPDAPAANPDRGPMGYVEWNISSLDDPHNAGWPYCHGPNAAYNEWDFATATPGEFFDCEAPVNNSRWNTGLTELPPSRSATLWYGDEPGHQPWDELVNFGSGRGQGPMGGPAYHYDAANPSTDKLPEYWDGKWFFGEFSQDYIAAFTVNDALEVTAIEDFMPNAVIEPAGLPRIDNPIDLEFGPDGALYVLEYGDGFFRPNPDAGLHRIAYAQDNRSPQAVIGATPHSSSSAPLTVQFDASGSSDPEGQALTYEWDFDGDGTFDATGVRVEHTYTELGTYTARLRVTDTGGKRGLASRTISVGNTAPEVTIEFPADGGFFQWGDSVPFEITTTDAEDGDETVCSRVRWTYGLGHDEHAHPEVSGTGCSGVFPTDANSPQHGEGADLYGAIVVTYTDEGANGLPPATGEATARLNPFLQEAEYATDLGGGEVVEDAEASAGRVVELGSGDTLRWDPVSFENIDDVVVRASGKGRLELRFGSPTAKPFAAVTLKPNQGWQDLVAQIAGAAPTETGALYVTSRGGATVDTLTFRGAGVGQAPQ
jgi:glucose/arabinose dehydrogenase/PKD repeat protein